MSEELKLPELPQVAANLDKHAAKELAATGRCHDAFVCGYGVGGDLHLYSAGQMYEYARRAILAERERATKGEPQHYAAHCPCLSCTNKRQRGTCVQS